MGKGDVNRPMDVQSASLFNPELAELAQVITKALASNYKVASCEVVDCPDLRDPPFDLAAPGIGGKTKLLEVGGVPYLVPTSQYMEKVYDFEALKSLAELSGSLILGAGAGSKHVVGVNCEMMPNLVLEGGVQPAKNNTRVAKVNPENDACVLEHYGEKYHSKEFCLLCNTFCSAGEPGKVLKVVAKQRTVFHSSQYSGQENLVSCMRKGILAHYGAQKPIGMGGTFLVKSGKLKTHVMPDFCQSPMQSEEDVANWLNFYEMESPFMCLSTFISHDPGLDLRVEHTHGYSLENQQGGHYHTDVTPDEVEYLGYFNTAEKIFRVDQPKNTHNIGRD